jgi:hypothetical protein
VGFCHIMGSENRMVGSFKGLVTFAGLLDLSRWASEHVFSA